MADFDDALCQSYSTDLWFPPAFDEEPTGKDSEYFEVGKMVCSVCNARSACSLAGQDEKYGMWGGATPAERRRGVVRPSKRLMNHEALSMLPPIGHSVDINPLRAKIRKVTSKRPSA